MIRWTQCCVEGGDGPPRGESRAAAQVVHRRGGEGVVSEVKRLAARRGLDGVRDTLHVVRETVEGDGLGKGFGGGRGALAANIVGKDVEAF